MIEKRVAIEAGASLTLERMVGDLSVTAWDEADVRIRAKEGTEEDLTIEETEAGLTIAARVPCEVCVPQNTPIAVREALNNLRVKAVHALEVQQVHGNLYLNDISEATIERVHGNLKSDSVGALQVKDTVYGNAALRGGSNANLAEVRGNCLAKGLAELYVTRTSGNLHVNDHGGLLTGEQIGGNALLKGVRGVVTLDRVGGNLTARDLIAGAKVAKIGGNLAFNGEIGSGCTYHFKAGGNALLRLNEGASTHVSLTAGGRVQSSAALVDQESSRSTLSGTLGDGGAEIVVEAGGNALLAAKGPAVVGTELREEVARQVEESMRAMEDSLRAIDFEAIGQQVSLEMEKALAELRTKLENVDWEHVGRRTERAMERAMERMQRDIDRLTIKAARRQEKMERMAARAAARQDGLGRTRTGDARAGAPEVDLNQERLAILKMVEEGKISPEEAGTLFDALQ
jgi:hypothetical protein